MTRSAPTDRRADLAQRIALDTPISDTQARALAAHYGCSLRTIRLDIAALRTAQTTDRAAVVSAGADESRAIAVLRLLGRFNGLGRDAINRLLFGTNLRASVQTLAELRARGWIWTHNDGTVRQVHDPARRLRPLRLPGRSGLTPAGLAYLTTIRAEANSVVYDHMHTRPARTPLRLRDSAQGRVCGAWCAACVDAARRSVWTEAIACITHCDASTRNAHHLPPYTHALLSLRLNTAHTSFRQPGWMIPWDDDADDGAPMTTTRRFALLLDRPEMPVIHWIKRAVIYRDRAHAAANQPGDGSTITPIVLTDSGKRAAAIGRAWRHAWPHGDGLITTLSHIASITRDDQRVVDGSYFALRQPASEWRAGDGWLLQDAPFTRDDWQRTTRGWSLTSLGAG